MRIHEYQAKAILKGFGVPVPRGETVETPAAARQAAERLGGKVVVKAQVHAGGRGKAGGIRVASSAAEAEAAAGQILGMRLRTPQTPPDGITVQRVLVEEAFAVARELYLAVTVDRETAAPVVMASEAGGMEIEEVAARSPEKILRAAVDPALGLLPFQVRRLVFALRLDGDLGRAGAAAIGGLYMAFVARDCSLAEVNPLVTTADGRLLALDAKLSFDDNALFRHPEGRGLRDPNEETPLDIEAAKYGLNYIKLDGNVGCMVNGAGLAMATMDIIAHAGGAPANFLDVGGGASAAQIENAFRILISDGNVRAVLVNIFGGILRCDVLADGIIRAARHLKLAVPVVIRMEGTNVEEGRRMLRESGLAFTTADGMKDAAEKVVRLASAPSASARGRG
jgi:succinyl-CoA synthetase beta subunit